MAVSEPARRVLVPPLQRAGTAPAGGTVHALCGLTMGTRWSVKLVDAGASPALQDLRHEVQAVLDVTVTQMSHWQADSDLGRFNRAPAGSWQALPQPFFDVLGCALQVAQASGGAYDPCAGALVNLWGFGPRNDWRAGADAAPPADAAIAHWLQQRAGQSLVLDAAGQRACQPGGLLLDLSSIAKGHAVDAVSARLRVLGFVHHLVEVGGELRGEGLKPDGQPWWVALEEPGGDVATSTWLALHGVSVATSGGYRRWLQHDGVRYAHTLDPRSGRPAAHGLASVTVVHDACMLADAWSTALTVLGPEQGLLLADQQGLAARFLTRRPEGLHEQLSRAMQALLD